MTSAARGLAPSRVESPPWMQAVEAALPRKGAQLALCFQCQKCTSGCPIAATADIKPHELVRLVQLGERDEVLSSRMIWECTSCQTCVTRCPHAVDLPAMIDALRRLSRDAGKVSPDNTVPVFNDIFLGAVRQMGRVYELGLMAAFKLRTRNLFQDVGKLPAMLRKRKLALRPAFVRGRSERARTFRRAERSGSGKR
jgi:heterodisulfide reductase subunit C